MSVTKHFIEDSIKKAGIDEFLWKEFERAGYGGVDIVRTPLGTNIVIYAMRPGIIIGRGGATIKNLARILEEKFGLPNPQISVAEIEVPELNPRVMASRIASALRRNVHFRRAGFWALSRIMEAGAMGAEIIISGKLRTERARSEKFRAGYLPKSGDPAMKYVKTAVTHVQLKPGVFGIKVSIMPPNVKLPDQIEFLEEEAAKEESEETVEAASESSTPESAEKPKEEGEE
ncbi:30S ribosomal protein S3 [Candidatus Bathyarchaeota archaeon]|nr:30S ribosomal protein S3 [Candidatus Bathyarchaeota archaeon]RLG96053.1 MAG: 30S ribosomal protein S3 [Candidatus Bathyarchaeota archaeon]